MVKVIISYTKGFFMVRFITSLIAGLSVLTLVSLLLFTANPPAWPEPENLQMLILSLLLQAYNGILSPISFEGTGLAIFGAWALSSAIAGLIAGRPSSSIKLMLTMPSIVILSWAMLSIAVFSSIYGSQHWLMMIDSAIKNIVIFQPLSFIMVYLITLVFSSVSGFLASIFFREDESQVL